jgi:hypothetical protein
MANEFKQQQEQAKREARSAARRVRSADRGRQACRGREEVSNRDRLFAARGATSARHEVTERYK